MRACDTGHNEVPRLVQFADRHADDPFEAGVPLVDLIAEEERTAAGGVADVGVGAVVAGVARLAGENRAAGERLAELVPGDDRRWEQLQLGAGQLADFEVHDQLAMRIGCAAAATTVNRLSGTTGGTEFNSIRVVDSGRTLASILPSSVDNYSVTQFALDASLKRRGWSSSLEYYFRSIHAFNDRTVRDLFDHGFWYQLGYFVVPGRVQLLTRWSRVVGDSGTLGIRQQSADELAGGLAWYFRENHAKLVADVTQLNGAPINSAALDISPRDNGWLYRMQIQFSF